MHHIHIWCNNKQLHQWSLQPTIGIICTRISTECVTGMCSQHCTCKQSSTINVLLMSGQIPNSTSVYMGSLVKYKTENCIKRSTNTSKCQDIWTTFDEIFLDFIWTFFNTNVTILHIQMKIIIWSQPCDLKLASAISFKYKLLQPGFYVRHNCSYMSDFRAWG